MLRYHCEVFTIYGCCFMKIFVNALSTPPIGGSAGEWVNLLCCARWQQLEIVPLVPWDPARQEDCVDLSVCLNKLDNQLSVRKCQCIVRESVAVPMPPHC